MRDLEPRRIVLRRKAAGYLWAASWIGALGAIAAPWRHLGGLESELLRWLEAVMLPSCLVAGFLAGRFVRDTMEDGGRTHARALRVILYPPAAMTAMSLVAMAVVGDRGTAGVIASIFLAYWGGLDLAIGAVPLMEGRSYAFARPLAAERRDSGARIRF